jgi:hypothetical protein
LLAFVNRFFVDVCLFFGCGSAARAESDMKHEMSQWGVDESMHAAFWKSNLEYLRNVSLREKNPQPVKALELLPNEPVEAVLVVMKQFCGALVKTKAFLKIRDTLEDKHPELKDLFRPLQYVSTTKRYELIPTLDLFP